MEYPKSLLKLIDEIQGKDIYCCHRYIIRTRINFDSDRISLCHENELRNIWVDSKYLFAPSDFSAENYYVKLHDIIMKFQNPGYPCRSCSQCVRTIYKYEPISFVVIGNTRKCNSDCIYCCSRSKKEEQIYDMILPIQELHEKGLLHERCFFDWGGGEPTLNPSFEKTAQFLIEKNYPQRFNTNAINFSPLIYAALKNGNGVARISVDSGTRECFRRVKGHEYYKNVWGNVHKYREASDEVYVKYIVFNLNSDLEEIDVFLDRCQEARIKHIIIDAEIRSYQPMKQGGPFYFREKEFEAAHYLEDQATSRGLNVIISAYAFAHGRRKVNVIPEAEAHCDYRGEGNIIRETYSDYLRKGGNKLPETYFDNIDYKIISSGVYLRAFATSDQLIEKIFEEPELPVYIFGSGIEGELVNQILKNAKLSPKFIDNNPKLDKDVIHAAKIMKEQPPAHIILASERHWEEMLKQINDCKYNIDGYVYYIHTMS